MKKVKISKIKNVKQKALGIALGTLGLMGLGQGAQAQVQSNFNGGPTDEPYDLYNLNSDYNNYDCGIRLNVSDNGYMLWQRAADTKFRISYGASAAPPLGIDNDLFELDKSGNTRFLGSIGSINSSYLTVNDGLIVTGNISDSNSDLKVADGLIVTGNVYDDGGDLTLNDNVIVTGNLYDNGSDLVLNDNVIVTGNLYDSGSDLARKIHELGFLIGLIMFL